MADDAGSGAISWHDEPLMAAQEIRLPGPHNRANAMAAAAVALARGIDPTRCAPACAASPASRTGWSRSPSVDGVAYVNDSKATNVDSTLVALRSYAGGVHLIAGGRTKAQDFSPLAPLVAERCAAVHLIGEGAGEIAAALAPADVPLIFSERPGARGRGRSRRRPPGEVVLLSPACASFDQYPDFEARGDALPRARGGAVSRSREPPAREPRAARRSRSSSACC